MSHQNHDGVQVDKNNSHLPATHNQAGASTPESMSNTLDGAESPAGAPIPPKEQKHLHFLSQDIATTRVFNDNKDAIAENNFRPSGATLPSDIESNEEEKNEITEDMCYEELGFSFPTWKKWTILSVIFIVQVSMNFNTSLYSNALSGISDKFGVSMQAARAGAAAFLIAYAFGCELWAPWSEEFGRFWILQISLGLVNIWQIPVALAPNFATIIIGRILGGFSSAGGSVTLGMIADMWEAEEQQYAVAFVVFSSVGGSVLGPVVGGFVEAYLPWQWCIWIQLIFGVFVQALHFFLVPETRSSIIRDRVAKRMREKEGVANIWGPDEMLPFQERINPKEVAVLMWRPFMMFLTEPIVMTLSLLSGFSDALIFMFIQSFSIVYKQWGFNTVEIGLSFIPLLLGYFLAWFIFIFAIRHNVKLRAANPDDEKVQFESRLYALLWLAPCLPLGLIIFAWTSTGPPLPWIASMIAGILVGVANYSIYMATIDYMVTAYGPFSASATGGNGWSRDFLAGVLTVPATPFFTNIGASQGPAKALAYASTILACISLLLVLAVYVIYWKGPTLRKRSPFAQGLIAEKAEKHSYPKTEHASNVVPDRTIPPGMHQRPAHFRKNSQARSIQEQSIRKATGSRQCSASNTPRTSVDLGTKRNSAKNTPTPSRKHTPVNSRRNSLQEFPSEET
ncbi:putative MFS multidrug transporter [Calycina marina]|uniref:MFS multidrug transporter n=1 Tax=Calycina marina TaxID=1763456 RepID=A0A9P7YWB8_9HELO|nr:putative MFS multidrug transporter [Calycina marina]